MVPRQVLAFLVFALPVLVVAFGVLMGGFALAQAAKDLAGAQVLWWVAMGGLMLLAVDVLLLVGALGVNALSQSDRETDDSSPQ